MRIIVLSDSHTTWLCFWTDFSNCDYCACLLDSDLCLWYWTVENGNILERRICGYAYLLRILQLRVRTSSDWVHTTLSRPSSTWCERFRRSLPTTSWNWVRFATTYGLRKTTCHWWRRGKSGLRERMRKCVRNRGGHVEHELQKH